MKIAISTDNKQVSAHFGRCQSYTIFEIEEKNIVKREIIPNPGHQPGFLPQFLSEKGVNCIITGGMGPRAQDLFTMKGIDTIIGVNGQVDEVIQKFIHGELEIGESQCTHGKGVMPHHRQLHHGEERNIPIKNGPQRICITARGSDLQAEVDPRFGRASYFLIIDINSMEYEAIKNPFSKESQGAGIKAAQFIAKKEVTTVLTGNVGPNAYQILNSGGIELVSGISGTIKNIIEEYRSGKNFPVS